MQKKSRRGGKGIFFFFFFEVKTNSPKENSTPGKHQIDNCFWSVYTARPQFVCWPIRNNYNMNCGGQWWVPPTVIKYHLSPRFSTYPLIKFSLKIETQRKKNEDHQYDNHINIQIFSLHFFYHCFSNSIKLWSKTDRQFYCIPIYRPLAFFFFVLFQLNNFKIL